MEVQKCDQLQHIGQAGRYKAVSKHLYVDCLSRIPKITKQEYFPIPSTILLSANSSGGLFENEGSQEMQTPEIIKLFSSQELSLTLLDCKKINNK